MEPVRGAFTKTASVVGGTSVTYVNTEGRFYLRKGREV